MKNIFGLTLITASIFTLSAKAADFTIELVPATGSVQFSDISNKPASYPPSVHGHAISEITNLQSELNSKASSASVTSSLSAYVPKSAIIPPKITKYLSSSGTFSTTGSPLYLRVKMLGGGGGGASGSASGVWTVGAKGGNTTFGSLLDANGGLGGVSYNGAIVLAPFTILAPASGSGHVGAQGGMGSMATNLGGYSWGGPGAASYVHGAVPAGVEATANTGAGGGGGITTVDSGVGGAGGSAGAYIDAIIPNPSASYPFSVGAGGLGGVPASNGNNRHGFNGGSGFIEVTEYYQ